MFEIMDWVEDLASKDKEFLAAVNKAVSTLLCWPLFAQSFDSVHRIRAAINEELLSRK